HLLGPHHEHGHTLFLAVGFLFGSERQLLNDQAILRLGATGLDVQRHLRPVEQLMERRLDLGSRRITWRLLLGEEYRHIEEQNGDRETTVAHGCDSWRDDGSTAAGAARRSHPIFGRTARDWLACGG